MSRTLRVAVATLALLSVPSVASAETWTSTDPTGDVQGEHIDLTPDSCPTWSDLDASADTNDDIRGVRVAHTQKVVRVKAVFADLDPAKEQSVTIHVATPRRAYSVDVNRYEAKPGHFKLMTFVSKEPQPPTDDQLDECGGWGYVSTEICHAAGVVDTDANVVTVTVPRACLHTPDWVQVGLSASGSANWDYSEEHTSGDIFSDYWSADGAPYEGWLPPYGPEVPPGPGTVVEDGQNDSPSNLSRVTKSPTGLRFSFVSSFTGLPSGTTAATAYWAGSPSSS